MGPFGLPNPNYTHFGAPFVEKWCPKEAPLGSLGSLLPPKGAQEGSGGNFGVIFDDSCLL